MGAFTTTFNTPRRQAQDSGIYSHRSFRVLDINPIGLTLAVFLSLALSMIFFAERSAILDAHQALVTRILENTGLTHHAEQANTMIFAGTPAVKVPPVWVPLSNEVTDAFRWPAIALAVILLIL